jgi:hypothetical protein
MLKPLMFVRIVLFCVPSMATAQSQLEATKSSTTPAPITVPNGTPIILRFAQPLVGVPQFNPSNPIAHANKGDLVSLVVATDIRVNGIVVVRKGGLAQATVMKANEPDWQYSDSGLELRFDWVKSINGQEIPLMHKQNGKKSTKFPVILFSTRTGNHLLTGFTWEHRSLADGLREAVKVKSHQQWTVIPTGTRAKAYVHGDIPLDGAAVQSAAAELPAPNPTATVTIYREKGPKDQLPHVVCDEKDFGPLADWQYFVVEWNPGKHTCAVANADFSDFTVSAGEEYYLQLHHSGMSGKWQITMADYAAGEDAITYSEPVGQISTEPLTHP